MTEKEMIKEMAKNIFEYVDTKNINKVCILHSGIVEELKRISHNYGLAEYLYAQSYRKIPEGSVVLSSEEYSNYLILQTNHEWIREKAKELQADNERLYKNLKKFKESVRKETAKEILSLAIKHDNGYETDMTRFISDLKKQYGVEE